MFFILSKIFAYVIMPVVIICALLIASAFSKKTDRKRKLFYVGLGLLLFFSNDFIVNEVARLWEVPITPYSAMHKNYTWAILLTGITRSEAATSDRVFFNRGADRVTHTVQLYKMGKIKKILVSGGSGLLSAASRIEADDVAQALMLMGIPDSVILKESHSRNTHESAVNTKAILKNIAKPEECLLITSAYHMRRSAACFAKVGWPIDCFSTDFISHSRKFTIDVLLIPKADALGGWQTLIREWVGMISYRVAGYI